MKEDMQLVFVDAPLLMNLFCFTPHTRLAYTWGGPSREGKLKSESKLFLRPIVDFAPPAARELLLLKTLHLLKFFPTYSAFYPPSCCQQTRVGTWVGHQRYSFSRIENFKTFEESD